jgi:hypothetical protein
VRRGFDDGVEKDKVLKIEDNHGNLDRERGNDIFEPAGW